MVEHHSQNLIIHGLCIREMKILISRRKQRASISRSAECEGAKNVEYQMDVEYQMCVEYQIDIEIVRYMKIYTAAFVRHASRVGAYRIPDNFC